MRRRKAPKVVWLPGTNANSIDAAGESCWNKVVLSLAPGSLVGDSTTGEVPIVIDDQADPLGLTTTLADVENSGYRLRRITGKIFAMAFGAQGSSRLIGLDAGFIIRSADITTGVSFAFTTGIQANVSPSFIKNQSDPWIWRRSWFLNNGIVPLFDPSAAPAATNVWQGPSGVDGPHIDQKTARIVGPEHRLYLTLTATMLDTIPLGTTADTEIDVFYTTRCLASMRTSIGNRRNASR